jgi:hypothetical protein
LFLYFYSTLLYIIFPVTKYGAPRQAKHEKINVFRPVSQQNFIPEYIFILSSTQIFKLTHFAK